MIGYEDLSTCMEVKLPIRRGTHSRELLEISRILVEGPQAHTSSGMNFKLQASRTN